MYKPIFELLLKFTLEIQSYSKTSKNFFLVKMSRVFSSQCDGKNPKDSKTIHAPGRIFYVNRIPQSGPRVLKDPPLEVARLLIRRGLSALHNQNSRAVKLWKCLTGHDDWRFLKLPTITLEDCYTLKNVIYLIFDDKNYNLIYVGQTIQKLEKRISDHVRNMKFLQRFGAFEEKAHKSLIAYRMAVYGIHDVHVLPWFCFTKLISPK